MSIRKHIRLILVRTLITAKSVIIPGSWRGSWHKGCFELSGNNSIIDSVVLVLRYLCNGGEYKKDYPAFLRVAMNRLNLYKY